MTDIGIGGAVFIFLFIMALGVLIYSLITGKSIGQIYGNFIGQAVGGTVEGVANTVAPNAFGRSGALGEVCSADAGCMPNLTCCDNICVAKAVLEERAPCCDDTQCKGGRCAWKFGAGNKLEKICCKNAAYDKSLMKWMCHDLPVGTKCQADNWCLNYNSSNYDRSRCENGICQQICSCGSTKIKLYEKADGTGKTSCYGNGKYSTVHPDKGWIDAADDRNDEFGYACVPPGKKLQIFDNDSGDKTGWYGWTEINGPYRGRLGGTECKGNCKAHAGSKGTLGTANKATSWIIA